VPAFAQAPETIQVYSAPSASLAQANVERFTVTGTVIDAVTGDPIRKALVQINGPQQRATFTDGDGRFQFEGIPAGIVPVSAQKPGYLGEQEMRSPMQATVEVGAKPGPVVLKLTPEGVISGKVSTTAGLPLEHVPISLMYLNVREGRRHWDSKGTANTAEDGRYRFANLLPGTYHLATAPFTPPVESVFEISPESKTGYPGVYYPGVPDMASSSPIQLSAGQQAEANFSLSEVPSYNISGTLSGYPPNQGANIQLCDQSGSPLPFTYQFSPENGRFDFHGVPAGFYVLRAFAQSAPNQPVRAETPVNVASDVHNLHLALAPWMSIPIAIHTESVAQPGPGSMKYSRPSSQGPPLGVRLLASRPGAAESYASLEGPSGQQTLMLRNVEPGRYTAELMPQPPWYVASAEYGQANLLTDDLVLTDGSPALPLNVVLRNDYASLTGTVRTPDPMITPMTVVAIPEGLPKASPKVSNYYARLDKSAGDAEFFLDSLAPGDYLVFAFDHGEGIEYSNPDVLQNYISQAAHVTLAPNQRGKVTLELIRTGEPPN
jgi:hypothetical protein